MYRSFLTCDDPKGVVQCGTIRKYRTCSHKMTDKTKVQKTDEHLMNKRYNNEEKFPKGNDGNGSLNGQSSMQFTQVSSGNQSLNNIIDSWSRDLKYDENSQDIAQHILKGALDLQDSLIMLHKLQEASQHTTTHFRRNLTEKHKRDRVDAKMISRMQANPFSEQGKPEGLQRPQPCASGSSSNCNEELKEVIEESLVRQNKCPKMTTEGLDSTSERFSTSSSQSSEVRTNSLSEPSFSVIASKVEKGPGLIFKLMGLEEHPSRSFPPVMQTHLDGEKVNMSKVKKKNLIAEKANPEQKALGETLDTMHSKGLLNKSFVKDPKLKVHHFNDLNSKQLIKTQCTQYNEAVKTLTPIPQELSMRKLKAEIVSSKTIKHRKGSISGSTNMGKEMEKGASKWLNKEEEPKFLKEVVKVDAKGTNPTEASSGKVKLFCHIGNTSQVNETIDKKWKVQTISRKQPEKDISEPRIAARPQYQLEITPTKLRKPKIWSRINKNEISSPKGTGSNSISISKTESLTCRKNQMKNQSTVSWPKPAKLTVEQNRQGEEKRSIHDPDKDDYAEIRIATTLEDELLMVCEADAYTNKIEECKWSKSWSGHDIMLLKSEQKIDSFPGEEEAHENTKCSEADSINPDMEGTELKHFLLTSQSFIGHAEKLLNLDVDCDKNETNYNYGIANNHRLYLDCANELSERKSLQESQQVPSRLHISLSMLVEEIYNAIENLKLYREDSGEEPFAMTEKDMKGNGMINGMWERGWRSGFSADEVDIVVNKVESLIVSGLIEEVIINL